MCMAGLREHPNIPSLWGGIMGLRCQRGLWSLEVRSHWLGRVFVSSGAHGSQDRSAPFPVPVTGSPKQLLLTPSRLFAVRPARQHSVAAPTS